MTGGVDFTTLHPRIVVIGGSSGALGILGRLIGTIAIPLPIVVVLHLAPGRGNAVRALLETECRMPVLDVLDKSPIENGNIYLAPSDYHLLVESNRSFALSVGPKVNYSRPSIDVLFESACDVFGPDLVAALLSGGSSDGAAGAKRIRDAGGVFMVQDPLTCEARTMPDAAIESASPQVVAAVDVLREHLCGLKLPEAIAGQSQAWRRK